MGLFAIKILNVTLIFAIKAFMIITVQIKVIATRIYPKERSYGKNVAQVKVAPTIRTVKVQIIFA